MPRSIAPWAKTAQMASAPMTAPTNWESQYTGTSRHGKRFVTASENVTAGLMWQPDTLPSAYTSAAMIRPKANEMPSRSAPVMAGFESPASTNVATTDPGPTRTSRAVPSTSAKARCCSEYSITPPEFRSAFDNVERDFATESATRALSTPAILVRIDDYADPDTGRAHRRAAPATARQPGRLLVQGQARPRAVRRQGQFDPQTCRQSFLEAGDARDLRDARPDRDDRLRGYGDRGRGAARGAELHPPPPAALQHPAARRQVVPLHRGQPGRGLPARLLHAREAPSQSRLLRAVLERQAHARDTRSAGQGLPVPHVRWAGAGPRVGQPVLGLLHQTVSSALRRLHQQGGLPREHREHHPLPERALSPDRARPRGRDVRRIRASGVRACREPTQPLEGGAVTARATADLERGSRHDRRDRRGSGGHRRERAGVPGARRRAGRPP